MNHKLNLKLFEEISIQLDNIITKYNPQKNIFLVVDGTAAMMKNLEQRQRRYKNSLENKYDNIFDLNSFSPGTKMLNFLTKYIDWFLRYKMNTDETYKNLNIYFATRPQYFEVLDGNPHVHKCIPYHDSLANLPLMEGQGEHEGYFEIAFIPFLGTQRIVNFPHNGKDKIQFELCT